ncbi:protein kinase [Trypanosoma rangeli SC58]|uniref:Protein kinase n=1 Tax=Trypanosoma rangeli SC58 TaxID=429131 RepID=A0A061JEN4_TRYRA|nr:protein kinase [Trypanosoma rangeli SC58]
MRKLRHKHVVRLLDVVESTKAYNLVMELAPNGELFDKIVTLERFDEKTARHYFQQLISAVHYCHSLNIAHRDLKAENLLLGERNELKVCDWGLARYTKEGRALNEPPVLFHSLAGSIDYQAPEVFSRQGYEGAACDMWSCGVILFFMICGYLPFADVTDTETKGRILKCKYNAKNRFLSQEVSELIAHLLQVDPKDRYDTLAVVANPWFQVDLDPSLFPNATPITLSSPNSPVSDGTFKRIYTPSEGYEGRSSLSPEHTDRIHQAFVTCNVGGTGLLSKDEVRDALIKLNDCRPVPNEEVEKFMSKFSLDKHGRISEAEFTLGYINHRDLGKRYDIDRMAKLFDCKLENEFVEEFRRAFNELDVKHMGLITPESLKELNLELTEEDIKDFFDVIDPDNKGTRAITFEKFIDICLRLDKFKEHPFIQAIRRSDKLFNFIDRNLFHQYLGTGFKVRGRPRYICDLLKSKQKELSTQFEGNARGTIYVTYTKANKVVLHVGVRLIAIVEGYTKVVPHRIAGKTTVFHEWFLKLRKELMKEILSCEQDIAVKGEPELI